MRAVAYAWLGDWPTVWRKTHQHYDEAHLQQTWRVSASDLALRMDNGQLCTFRRKGK